MQAAEGDRVREIKAAIKAEVAKMDKAFDKIGGALACQGCHKVSTDCMLMQCGHSICAECMFKSDENTVTCIDCKLVTLRT